MRHALALWQGLPVGENLATWQSPSRSAGQALAMVACLLECGLTLTIHATICRNNQEFGLFSIKVAERNRVRLANDKFRAQGHYYREC